jgi:Tfp pilus assembly protein PilV
VEVMMASVILVVGFMGMIQAVTIGSEMLATARRQTLAAQILNHEMEKLRLTAWNNLPSAGNATISLDTQFNDALRGCGLTSSDIQLSRTTTDLISSELKEVTFTITWQKRGTTTAATTPTGSWLERLAFYRESPIARTYTRRTTSWFTKYGLNHAAQRS